MNKLFLIALAFVSLIVFGCSIFGIRSINQKYRIGMTIEEVQAILPGNYTIDEAGVDYESGSPNAEQAEKDPAYLIDSRKEGLLLYFNHNRKLIKIDKKYGV